MAAKMDLKPGMRILDLGAGCCTSSIFLARHYPGQVVAADWWINPSDNWPRIQAAGQADRILPIRLEAHTIPFAEGYFDVVFCMNAYFYFGTDDLYLPYLAKFVRPGGQICIASPCYSHEMTPDTPKELQEEGSLAWHSPGWWRHHFEMSSVVDVLYCEEHPKGLEFWQDEVRWLLEECHPRDRKDGMTPMILGDITMILSDQERFLTYFMLLAQKR
jgi:cyclopropane fatty-acyl-phospholipid synthase-like methyltransferase